MVRVAALHKNRLQVELFFKRDLRIKRFLGTSENTVKTQIWCVVATYVLIATARRSFISVLHCISLTHNALLASAESQSVPANLSALFVKVKEIPTAQKIYSDNSKSNCPLWRRQF